MPVCVQCVCVTSDDKEERGDERLAAHPGAPQCQIWHEESGGGGNSAGQTGGHSLRGRCQERTGLRYLVLPPASVTIYRSNALPTDHSLQRVAADIPTLTLREGRATLTPGELA